MSVGLFALGSESSGIEVNAWIKSYDPEAFEGRGDADQLAQTGERPLRIASRFVACRSFQRRNRSVL